MKVTICGPNLRDQTRGQFHVHKAGCLNLKRGEPIAYESGWEIEVSNRTELCDAVYDPGEFNCKSGEYMDDFYFFPCVAALE